MANHAWVYTLLCGCNVHVLDDRKPHSIPVGKPGTVVECIHHKDKTVVIACTPMGKFAAKCKQRGMSILRKPDYGRADRARKRKSQKAARKRSRRG